MNIFITGGISGMGLLIGNLFKKEGHNIGVCSFQENFSVPEGFKYYMADVTNEDAVTKAIDQFVEDFGKLDIVIANAGMNMPKTIIPNTNLGTKVTKVNVLGVVHTFNASLPHFLKQNSGHFVAISSMSALNGLPGMSYYGASKAFVASFCESLACDLKDKNIDVTYVTPGFVATDFVKNNKHKMPYLLTPDEAAKEIYNAIIKKKNSLFFPLVPYLFMNTLKMLPRNFYVKLMRKDLLKLRAKE